MKKTYKTWWLGSALLLAGYGAFAQALPAEWMDLPFGNFDAANPGAASQAGGVFTVSGSGNNMYGTADDGGRFVFQPLAGDGEVVAAVERVAFSQAIYGRAGLMFRNNNQRESATAIFYRSRFDPTNGMSTLRGQYRASEAATMVWQTERRYYSNEWMYVRLVRQGDVFTSYYTTNATPTEWQLGDVATVTMGEAVNAGLFVAKYGTQTVKAITNRFDQVAVRPFVAVAQAGADALAVSWVAQPPVTNVYSSLTYTLSRGASRTGPFTVLADGLTDTAYTNTVDVGPTYYYRVAAVCDGAATNLIGVSGGRRIAFVATNLVTAAANGYWAESYTVGAEFVVRTSRVVNAVLNTAITNGVVLHGDAYHAYYTATLVPTNTDDYFIQTRFNDAGRVWLGDDLIINDMTAGASRPVCSAPIRLEAGRAVTLRVYHYQNDTAAEVTVQWARMGDKTFADIPLNFVSPLPSPWRSRDFGLPHLNGFAEYDFTAKQFTVTAGGSADSAAEAGHYAYQETAGDFSLQTCVASQSGTQKKAGLLIRASVSNDAARAGCFVGDGQLIVELRDAAGGAVTSVPVTFPTDAPVRLKAEYVGGTLSFFCKANPTDAWAVVTNLPFTLPWTAYAGVAAQSLSDTEANRAVFSETSRVGVSVPVAPEADAQVLIGSTNFGRASYMTVKHWDAGTTSEALLRFNTKGLSSVRTAKLRLYALDRAATGAAANQTLIVRRLQDNAWGETNVTWANPPAGVVLPSGLIGTDDPLYLASVKVAVKGTYTEIDLTAAVRASAQADGRLSLQLHTSAIYDANPAQFATREYGDATKRPALVCYGDGPVGLTAEPGAAANEIALVWRLVEDPSATYTVKRATAAEGPFTVIATNVFGYTYYDKSLTPGTRYYYTLTAVTPAWESPVSPVVSALPDALTRGTQEALADVYVQAGTTRDTTYNSTTIVLKSSCLDDTFQREGFIKFNVAGLGSVQNARLRLMPQVSDEAGKTLLTTYIDIEAFGSGNWTEAGTTWNNSPFGYPLPIRTRDLTWPDQVQKVRFRVAPNNQQQEIDITPLVQRVARVSDFMTLYIYRVDGYGNNNCIFYPREDGTAARRPALLYALQRPGAPGALFTNGLVTVTWPAYTNATSYTLARATAVTGEYATVASGLTARTYTDRAALTGQSYFYKVTAVTAGGPSAASDASGAMALGLRRLVAKADTYLDQAAPTGNFGANTELTLKAYRSGNCREGLFRFDVRGLEAVQSARVRLNIAARDAAYIGSGVVVYDVTGSVGDWDEMTVTWNLPPKGYVPPTTNSLVKASNELARVLLPYRVKDSGTHVTFIEADATAAVRAAAEAGRDLMVRVSGDDMLPHGQSIFSVASRENAADERRPALICATASAANPVALAETVASNRTVAVSWWPVGGAVSYTVTRLAPDGTATVIADQVAGTSVTDAGLWNGDSHLYTYRVEARYADGSTGPVADVAVSVPRTFERRITDDTYAMGGLNSNTVHGAEVIFGVKNDVGDTARETYLRVDLSGLPPVTGASLKLTAQSFNVDKVFTLVAESVADLGWTETGASALTWLTARGYGATATQPPPVPAANEAANRIDVTALEVGSLATFDITRLVQAAQAADAPSLVVHVCSANSGGTKMIWFHSSEAADMGDQPKVAFTVAVYPPPGTQLLLK